MKKKLLALLLTFLMLVNLVPPDVFAATASGEESAAITIPACSGSPTCWGTVNGDPIHNHVDGCARKDYLKDYVTSSTAADIAAVWSGFTAEEQADILLMVQAYTGYIDELKALVDTGTTPEPELPSVSTTVTVDGVEQTVTVKGETLPEGAKLTVTPVANEAVLLPELDIANGFLWDIKVQNGNNSIWQPADGDTVNVTLPIPNVPNDNSLNIIHVLDTPEAIEKALRNGTAQIGSVAGESDAVKQTFAAAVSAYAQVTGEADTFAAEYYENIPVIDGYITFSTSGFSIYSWNGSFSHTRYENTTDDRYVLRSNNGGTLYMTRNQLIHLDSGENAGDQDNWTFSGPYSIDSWSTNDRPRLRVNSDATIGATITVNVAWGGFLGIGKYNHTIYLVVVEERTVTFNGNGGTPESASATAITDNGSHVQNVTLPNSSTTSRTGYTLTGWKLNNTGTNYAPGASYMPSSSGQTLYAQWSANNYTLTFNANGGSVSPASKTVTYDSAYGDLPTPSRTNYRFLGWYTAASGGTQVTSATVHKTAGNTTIYAHWTWDVQITNTYDGYLRPAGATPASYKWYRDSASYVDKNTTWNNSWTAVSSSNLSGNNVNVLKDKGYVQEDSSTVSGDAVSGIKYRYRLDALDSSGNVIGSAYYTVNFGDHILNSSFEAPYQGPKTCMGYVYNQENIFWSSTVTGEIHSGRPWDIELVGSESAGFSNKIAFDGDQYAEINANAAAALYQDVITEPNSYFGWSLSHSCRLTSGTDTMYVLIAPSNTARFVETQDELDILINNAKSVADAAATEEAKADVMSGETQLTATVDGQTVVYRIWEISSAFNDVTTWTLHSGNYYVPAGQQMTRFFFAAGETAATAQGDTTNGDTIGNLVDSVSFADKIYYTVNYYLDGKLLPQYGESGGGDAGDVIYSNTDTINAILNNGATMLQSVYLNNTYQAVSDQPSMTLAENRANNLHLNFASNYTLTFNFNGSGRADSSFTVTYNSSNYYEVNWLDPVRDGHSFDGWFTLSEGGVQVYSDDGYCLEGDYWDSNNRWIGSSDLTVYAHWTPLPYTVTWVDGDGKTLKTDSVLYGDTPAYTGATPTKKADAQYTYTFNGTWSPAISAVTGDATYTAQFDRTVNKYTVTWVNHDGSLLETDTNVPYGTDPSYDGAAPTKPADSEYTYKWVGWNPTVSAVTGNVIYVASYDRTPIPYTVTWVDGDGKTLKTESYYSNDIPSYTGATPTKKADDQYIYTFNGKWSPAIVPVTGDATYTAQFDSAVNEYTVTWVDGDGKTLGETVYKYGDTPAYTGAAPTKKATDQYTYTFNGTWSPEIVTVTGDATYTAQFDKTVNSYTVTWVDGDGKTLGETVYKYGDTPAYTGAAPTKKADAQYTYTFNGTWSPEIVTVTGDATYTAQFDKTVNSYTVTWV
ncbi:MAG: InlB B-repeat-containing protein, partial [Oscillospiraceae bacterium]|nr:InlB B-repeat-containing protein [Oscillospiraceae bacterium]